MLIIAVLSAICSVVSSIYPIIYNKQDHTNKILIENDVLYIQNIETETTASETTTETATENQIPVKQYSETFKTETDENQVLFARKSDELL